MLILGGVNEVLTAGITKQCCRVYGHGRSADAKAKPKPQVKPKPKVVNRYHDLNYSQSHSTVAIESLSDEAPEDQIALPVPLREQQFRAYEAALKRMRSCGT